MPLGDALPVENVATIGYHAELSFIGIENMRIITAYWTLEIHLF